MPRRSEGAGGGTDVGANMGANMGADAGGDSCPLLERLIGLGERQVRRTYLPEQQSRLEALERFRCLLENISDAILVVDMADGTLVDTAGAVRAVTGHSPEAILGHRIDELLLAQTVESLFADPGHQCPEGGATVLHSGLRHADGTIRPVEIKAQRAVFGTQCYGVLVASDITERMRTQERLSESELRYRTVADHTYDMECWQSPTGKLLYVSPSCERITGYRPERFLRDPGFLETLIVPDDRELWLQAMGCATARDAEGVDFRIQRRDGVLRWVTQVCRAVVTAEGRDLGIRFSLRDITERKKVEDQLRHQALHDPLTGLANRVLCLDRIRQAMHRAQRRGDYNYGVVFMDLDGFRVINQSLGHAEGDALLVEVGRRLRRCVRHLDTLSRFGSDEFVMVLEELERPGESVRVVRRVREELAKPLAMNGRDVRLTASYGIVSVPRGSRPEEVLQHANIAMHRAKEKGRDRLAVFSSAMLDQVVRRLDLENDLRRALAAGEFVAHFQPIVGLADGRVRGFEALVRWDHPIRGQVSPGEFITLAEETGLIHTLGMAVLDQAVRAMAAWRQAGLCAADAFMSVNLSARQFSHKDLVRAILENLDAHGLPPGALNLEITESAIMEDPASAIDKLTRLKEHGIRLSVDDFGTGYSSMSYLKRFPLDHLKIDLGFVRTIDTDQENLEIVKAIISLAHSLRLSVVGEGVEQAAQGDILRALGCEYGQGFFYSRPLDRAGAEAYLATRRPGG